MQTSAISTALNETVPVLGVTLLLCLIVGKISKKFGIPKVSGYIVLGMILGPGASNFLSGDFVHSFRFFNDLALGMILFNIGGEFNKKLIQKMKGEQLLYSILSVQFTFLFVFVLYFGLSFLVPGMAILERFIISLFLGLVAVEAAPPTTLLVLKEYNADGILTKSIKIYLAFATITAVIGTLILTKVLQFYSIWDISRDGSFLLALEAFWNISGSVILGILIGFFLSYFERYENKPGNILFAVIAAIFLGQSCAHYLKVDSLLISLFIGFTLANASSAGDKIHEVVKDMGSSIYALFFVLAGTHIDLSNIAKSVGLLGLIYIVARIIGIILASYLTASFLKIKDDAIKKYHGLGVLSHAGAALAIVQRVQLHEEASAQAIFNIVVASIFVFELLGPFLLKIALFKTEEISSWNPTTDKTSKLKLNFSDIIHEFKINITPETKKKVPKGPIEDLIKKDVIAIQADANLESIKSFITDNHTLYPVVNKDHCFLGTLNLSSIKRALEENEDQLITAHSLIGESSFIPSNISLQGAKDIFSMTQKEALPVVNPVNRLLVGILFQKDIIVSISQGKDQNLLEDS